LVLCLHTDTLNFVRFNLIKWLAPLKIVPCWKFYNSFHKLHAVKPLQPCFIVCSIFVCNSNPGVVELKFQLLRTCPFLNSNIVNDSPELCSIDLWILDIVSSPVLVIVMALFVYWVALPVHVYCFGVISVGVPTLVLCTHVGSINISDVQVCPSSYIYLFSKSCNNWNNSIILHQTAQLFLYVVWLIRRLCQPGSNNTVTMSLT
jgi:hypothetical protein